MLRHNFVKKSASLSILAILMCLSFYPVRAADLPKEVVADQYLLGAKKATDEGNFQKAGEFFEKINQLGIEVPTEFYFFYGRNQYKLEQYASASDMLTKYVSRAGRGGQFYQQSLELLNEIQPRLEKAQKLEALKKKQAQEFDAFRKALAKSDYPKTVTDSLTGMQFVFVPGGCYRMGNMFGDTDRSEEYPVHEVCVSHFYMGKYEVTQDEYKKIMGGNPSHFDEGGRYPVDSVKWSDAQAFIQRLNQKTGKAYRLPTEAEWEYAAREQGKKVRFGTGKNTIRKSDANYNCRYKVKNSQPCRPRGETTPVGSFEPNRLGLFDMAGNVSEPCLDVSTFGYYERSPKLNPAATNKSGGFENDCHVLRGGSWKNNADFSRADYRAVTCDSLSARPLDGFRLVLPVAPSR